jgi:hypothetical protein
VHVNRAGCVQLAFDSDGTDHVTEYGGTFDGSYRVDGARFMVEGPTGTQVSARSGDRLEGGYGTVFVRRPTRAGQAGIAHPLDAPPPPTEPQGAREPPCDDDADQARPPRTRGVPS